MRPEEAWETVKSLLQSEMPKGTFDARVRSTRLISYDNAVFTLATPDPFTRAWLEDRLTRTVARQLMGALNTEVQVRFVTEEEENAEEGRPMDSAPPAFLEDPSISPAETFQPLQTDLHNVITRPHAQTVVPAYLLRWLPYLGPDGGWFLVAMYQAFYFSENARVAPDNQGTLFQVSRNWLRTWSGLGTNKIAGLLEATSPTGPKHFIKWFLQGTQPAKGQARQYCFRVDMPLTPGDLEALTAWLVAHGIKEDPLAALETAVNTPVRDILPFPAPPPAAHHAGQRPQPTTVLTLVQALSEKKLHPRLLTLARQLQTNLLPPGDNLHLTHYFLRHWVKRLKPGPAWVVAVLRDKGFQDTTRGILRDRVQLKNGYQELATLLGVTEERLSDWLPPLSERVHPRGENGTPKRAWQYQQKSRQQLENFIISKTGSFDTRGAQNTQYTFRIRLDDPLIPDHAQMVGLLEAVLWQRMQKETRAQTDSFMLLFAEVLQGKQAGVDSKQLPQKTPSSLEVENKQGENEQEWTLNSLLTGWSGFRAGVGPLEVEFKQLLEWTPRDIKASLLKLFNKKVLYEIQQLLLQSCVSEENDALGEEEAIHKGGWTPALVMQVLAQEGIQAEKRRACQDLLEEQPHLLPSLVGWFLYGYAHKTTATRRGIDAPAFYALSRFAHQQPLPQYLEVARIAPTGLVQALQNPYSAQLSAPKTGILRQAHDNGVLEVLRGLDAPP